MSELFNVIAPVFVIMGAAYVAVWTRVLDNETIDRMMVFNQTFVIPCLLFTAITQLDLSSSFDPTLLGTYYFGAFFCFAVGLFGARYIFGRPWDHSVAIGFCALFSNSVMLGLPITARAYGASALDANYAIIAVHAPLAYGVGITIMEIVRADTTDPRLLVRKVLRAMFRNSLVIALALGFIVNFTHFPMPAFATDAIEMLARAAIPLALFGLGGVLVRYRPEGEVRVIIFVVLLSLIVHPVLVWVVGQSFDLPDTALRSALITSAMAPGINVYIFANMYGVAKRVAASSVLIGTILVFATASVWLTILP